MKIGIVTFHWASNYGAVLQAYALQRCLMSLGHEVKIVDYKPQWASDVVVPGIFRRDWRQALDAADRRLRRHRFNRFRQRRLIVSDDAADAYDVIIAGSDQVFNPDIIAHGGRIDGHYLLDFGEDGGYMRMAYAASLGNSGLDEKYAGRFAESLSRFAALGVREKSGVDAIASIVDKEVALTPDPTFLVDDWSDLLRKKSSVGRPYVFEFVFHRSPQALNIVDTLGRMVADGEVVRTTSLKEKLHRQRGVVHPDVERWLALIRDAKLVVADSFHAIVFCILLHTPFVALSMNAWGSDWSERIRNLLQLTGLSDRFATSDNVDRAVAIASAEIDWATVDARVSQMRCEGLSFLKQHLENR